MMRRGCRVPLGASPRIIRRVLGVAAATFIMGQMSVYQVSGAQQQPSKLEHEIADIEGQIDAIESQAIAGIPSLLPGSPQRLPAYSSTRSSRSIATRLARSAICRR